MRKPLLGLAAIAAIATPLALVAGPASAAGLGSNLSFEQPAEMSLTDGYHLVNATDLFLTDWTVGGAGVDIVNDSLWGAKDGSRSIDMNAFGPGSISQAIATVPNQVYEVSFSMSGNPGAARGPKTMDVSAADTQTPFSFNTQTMENTEADMKYQPQTFTFVAKDASTTLTFTSTTTATDPAYYGALKAAWGPVIDNVVVTAKADVAKTHVWHTWTGGPVTSAPDASDSGWHPTNGDPQSKLHKYENHTDGLPYYVANNGNKGGGSWFLWLDVTA